MSKLPALLLIVFLLAAAVALSVRPGTVLGISDQALATSIARSAGSPAGGCHHRSGTWSCTDGDSRMYRATVGDFGCWEAVTVDDGGRITSLDPVSGCVNLPDLLGIGH